MVLYHNGVIRFAISCPTRVLITYVLVRRNIAEKRNTRSNQYLNYTTFPGLVLVGNRLFFFGALTHNPPSFLLLLYDKRQVTRYTIPIIDTRKDHPLVGDESNIPLFTQSKANHAISANSSHPNCVAIEKWCYWQRQQQRQR